MLLDKIKEAKKIVCPNQINRIIEMAWEDRTPFDAIKISVWIVRGRGKNINEKKLKFSSYKLWRKRVENCKTKHAAKRLNDINKFKK